MFTRQNCPICGELFHVHALQHHVNSCLDKQQQQQQTQQTPRQSYFGQRSIFTKTVNALHHAELEASARTLISESLMKRTPIPIPIPKPGSFVFRTSSTSSLSNPNLDVGVVLSSSTNSLQVGFLRNLSTLNQILGQQPGVFSEIPSLDLHAAASIETISHFVERKSLHSSAEIVHGELLRELTLSSSSLTLNWKHYLHPLPSIDNTCKTSATLLAGSDESSSSSDLLTIDEVIYEPLRWLGKITTSSDSDQQFRAYYAVPDVFHTYSVLPLYFPFLSLDSIQSVPRSIPSTLFARLIEVLSGPKPISGTFGGSTWTTIEFEDEEEVVDVKRHSLKSDARRLCARPVFCSPEGLCDCNKDHGIYLELLSSSKDKENAKRKLFDRLVSIEQKQKLMNISAAISSGGSLKMYAKCNCQTAWYISETCSTSKVIIRLWQKNSPFSTPFVRAEGAVKLGDIKQAQLERLYQLSCQANNVTNQIVCTSVPACLHESDSRDLNSESKLSRKVSLKKLRASRSLNNMQSFSLTRESTLSAFEVEGVDNLFTRLHQYRQNTYSDELQGLSVGDVLLRAFGVTSESAALKASILNDRRYKPERPTGIALAVDRVSNAISTLSAIHTKNSPLTGISTISSSLPTMTSTLQSLSMALLASDSQVPVNSLIGAESVAESLFETPTIIASSGAINLSSFAPPTWRLASSLNPLPFHVPNMKPFSLHVDHQGNYLSHLISTDLQDTFTHSLQSSLVDPALLDMCLVLRSPGPGSLIPQRASFFCNKEENETKNEKSAEIVVRVQFRYLTRSDVITPYGFGTERMLPLFWATATGSHALVSILLKHFDSEIDLQQYVFENNPVLAKHRISSRRRSDGLSALDLALAGSSIDHARCVGLLIRHYNTCNKERGSQPRIAPLTASCDPRSPEGENSTLSRNSLHIAIVGGNIMVIALIARLQKLFLKQYDAFRQLPLTLALHLERPYIVLILAGPIGFDRTGSFKSRSSILSKTMRRMFPTTINPFEFLLPAKSGFASFRLLTPHPFGHRNVYNGMWSLGSVAEVNSGFNDVSPLHEFSAYGNVDAVALLLYLGANATAVFGSPISEAVGTVSHRTGDTPLHSAIQYFITNSSTSSRQQALEIVHLLLQSGARPRAKNHDGNSVIHDIAIACARDSSTALIQLLQVLLCSASEESLSDRQSQQQYKLKKTFLSLSKNGTKDTPSFPFSCRNNKGKTPLNAFLDAGGSISTNKIAYNMLSVFNNQDIIPLISTGHVFIDEFSEPVDEKSISVEVACIDRVEEHQVETFPSETETTASHLILSQTPTLKQSSLIFSFLSNPTANLLPLLRRTCSTCGAMTTSILDSRLMIAPWLHPPCHECGSVSSYESQSGELIDERWRLIAEKVSSSVNPFVKEVDNQHRDCISTSPFPLLKHCKLGHRMLNDNASFGYSVLEPDEVELYRLFVSMTITSRLQEMGIKDVPQSEAIQALDKNFWSVSESISTLAISRSKDQDNRVKNESVNLQKESILTKVSCTACLEDVDFSFTYSLPCLHRFCMTCWKSHLAASLEREGGPSGLALITCLNQPDCKEKVNDETWTTCADERTLERYKKLKLKVYTQMNKRLIACGNPISCRNHILLSSEGLMRDLFQPCDISKPPSNIRNDEDATTAAVASGLDILRNVDREDENCIAPVNHARCSCGFLLCVLCLNEAHSPALCSDVIRWRELVSDETDASSVRLMLRTTKKCPNCSSFIYRDGGCNHIKCGSCRYEFCHSCGLKWNGYDHVCKFSELTPMNAMSWNKKEGLSLDEASALGKNVQSSSSSTFTVFNASFQEKRKIKDLRQRYEEMSIRVGTQSVAQDFIARRIEYLSSSSVQKAFANLSTKDSAREFRRNNKYDSRHVQPRLEARLLDNKKKSYILTELKSTPLRFFVKERSVSDTLRIYDSDDSSFVINLSSETSKVERSNLIMSLSSAWTRIVSVAHYVAIALADDETCATWKEIVPKFYSLLQLQSSQDTINLCCSSSSWDFMKRKSHHLYIPWCDIFTSEIVSELLIATDFLPTNSTSDADLLQIALSSGTCSTLVGEGFVRSSLSECDRPLRQPWFQCIDCAEAFVGVVSNEIEKCEGAGAIPNRTPHTRHWKRKEHSLDTKIGICASCALTCHRGHSIRYLGILTRACQCGTGLCRSLLPTDTLSSSQTSLDVSGRIAFLPSHSRTTSTMISFESPTSTDDKVLLRSLRLVHGCVATVPAFLARSSLVSARSLILRNISEPSGKTIDIQPQPASLSLNDLKIMWEILFDEDDKLMTPKSTTSYHSKVNSEISTILSSPLSEVINGPTMSRNVLLSSLLQFISSSRFLQNLLIRTMYRDFDNRWGNSEFTITSNDFLRRDLLKHQIQLLTLILDDLFSTTTPFATYEKVIESSSFSIAGVDVNRASNLAKAAHSLCQKIDSSNL